MSARLGIEHRCHISTHLASEFQQDGGSSLGSFQRHLFADRLAANLKAAIIQVILSADSLPWTNSQT